MAARRSAPRRKPSRRAAEASARGRATPRRPAPKRAAPLKRVTAKKSAKPLRTAAAKPARSPMSMPAPNGKPVASGIGLTHHHMDYGTHDPEAMRNFFVDLLGFTNVHYVPEHRYLTVFLTPTSSLGFMPPVSTPEKWQPPGEPNFYFFVANVDAAWRALSERGVVFDQAPTDMPWGHRLAVLRDPEGRRVCLAQDLHR